MQASLALDDNKYVKHYKGTIFPRINKYFVIIMTQN